MSAGTAAKLQPMVGKYFSPPAALAAHLRQALTPEESEQFVKPIMKMAKQTGFAGVPTTGLWVIVLLVEFHVRIRWFNGQRALFNMWAIHLSLLLPEAQIAIFH